MDAEPVFVDTNVLVHANNEDSPFREEARTRLLQLAEERHPLWISRQVLREYAAVLSRLMNESNAFVARSSWRTCSVLSASSGWLMTTRR